MSTQYTTHVIYMDGRTEVHTGSWSVIGNDLVIAGVYLPLTDIRLFTPVKIELDLFEQANPDYRAWVVKGRWSDGVSFISPRAYKVHPFSDGCLNVDFSSRLSEWMCSLWMLPICNLDLSTIEISRG